MLLNWQRLSLVSLKRTLDEEKVQTVWRVDEIYKRIDKHKSENTMAVKDSNDETYKCRKEIDEKMAAIMEIHMTEPHIKEYVNGKVDVVIAKVVPLEKLAEKQLLATETLSSDVSSLKSDLRVTNTLIAKLAEKN